MRGTAGQSKLRILFWLQLIFLTRVGDLDQALELIRQMREEASLIVPGILLDIAADGCVMLRRACRQRRLAEKLASHRF